MSHDHPRDHPHDHAHGPSLARAGERHRTPLLISFVLIGSFFVAKAAANLMQHNTPNADLERGVIISTASIAAFEGQIGQAAYSASKGGVVAMPMPMEPSPMMAMRARAVVDGMAGGVPGWGVTLGLL